MDETVVCARCSRNLPKGRRRYCCDDCAMAAKKSRPRANSGKPRGNQQMMWRTICISCGAEIVRPVKCIRCKACQDEVTRNRAALYRANGPRRPLGSTDRCQRCGGEYIVESGKQKYCKACAVIATKDAIRAHKREYMMVQRVDPVKREEINAAKRIVKQDTACAWCGKMFFTRTRAVYCSDECRRLALNERQRMYSKAHAKENAARRRERMQAMTKEQREAHNARMRENYRKRKEREKKGDEKGKDVGDS